MRRRATLLCLLAGAVLAGCGSGTVTRTESGPPHVLSVTVPVSVPSPAAQAPTATAAQAPPSGPAKPLAGPPGHGRKRDKHKGPGGGDHGGRGGDGG
jgi:hypothetical protein